jgi:hypothetical protein
MEVFITESMSFLSFIHIIKSRQYHRSPYDLWLSSSYRVVRKKIWLEVGKRRRKNKTPYWQSAQSSNLQHNYDLIISLTTAAHWGNNQSWGQSFKRKTLSGTSITARHMTTIRRETIRISQCSTHMCFHFIIKSHTISNYYNDRWQIGNNTWGMLQFPIKQVVVV